MREKEVLHLVPKPQRAALTGGVCRADASVTKERRTLPDGAESYVLEILPEEIRMTGEEAGLFYAERTLEQLRVQFPGEIPCLRIEDAPRFPHRGFMLDSARHFLPEPDVMTLIDAASYFKLNRFHWHLVDDQGWRIESERYPRLHGTGSVRSGSDFGIEEPPQKNASGGAEYRGCYTKAQIRRIVRFAAERNVEIIPEIEIPGHETAAIAAYPELGCTGQAVPVETRPGIFAELICVGREECFTFLTEVLTEILELFPGKLVHIGGG